MPIVIHEVPGFLAMKTAAEQRYPKLGVHGFSEKLDDFEESHDYTDALACYHWLRTCTRPVTPRQGLSSYWLKHRAEEQIGRYVPNGALILAAEMHGFYLQRIPRSPNALIGVRLYVRETRPAVTPPAQRTIPLRVRRPISPGLRARVLERDSFRCRRCGASSDTDRLVMDHVVPVAHGGPTSFDNLQTLCAPCNSGKRARLPHVHDLRGLTS